MLLSSGYPLERHRPAYRNVWQSPGIASAWQRGSQSGVASGTCPSRTLRVAFDLTSVGLLPPLGAGPSDPGVLPLQRR